MFESFIRDLPDGTFWPTGKWFKSLLHVLESDRARLGENSGTELPTSKGRFFQFDEGDAAADGQPFELVDATDENGPKIRVVVSTLGNIVPTGFSEGDDPPYTVPPSGSSGYVYGFVTIDASTGEVTSTTLAVGTEVPTSDDTNKYIAIGTYTTEAGAIKALSNLRYGPIDFTICRDWFSADKKFIFSLS